MESTVRVKCITGNILSRAVSVLPLGKKLLMVKINVLQTDMKDVKTYYTRSGKFVAMIFYRSLYI